MIKSYLDLNGQKLWSVYVSYRSKKNQKHRAQKKKVGLISKASAERMEKELLSECINEVNLKDEVSLPWGIIVEKWYAFELQNKISNVGAETLMDYFASMKKWTTLIWDKPAETITKSNVREIINELMENNSSKSFQAKIKMTINKIFTWAIDEELINTNCKSPTIGIKIDRKQEKVPEILTLVQLKTFLVSANKLEHPWRYIWHMAILTGCRSGELYALEWSDVDMDGRLIRISKSFNNRRREIKSPKNDCWRNVPINNELMKVLITLKENATTTHVLPRFRDWTHGVQAKILRSFLISIGLPPVRFHALRACFATHLLKSGVSPASVMKIAGWKDLETMARYIRLAAIDERGATEKLKILSLEETSDEISTLLSSTEKED
jgi:integrase